MFEILQKVVLKHLGLEEIIDHVLAQIGEVNEIRVLGDYAKGIDTGLIEVLLIGNELNTKYLTNLEEKIEKLIERKVQFIISNRKSSEQHIFIISKIKNVNNSKSLFQVGLVHSGTLV